MARRWNRPLSEILNRPEADFALDLWQHQQAGLAEGVDRRPARDDDGLGPMATEVIQ